MGKFDFRKQLGLAIRAVAATGNQYIQLHVCGTGSEQEMAFLPHWQQMKESQIE